MGKTDLSTAPCVSAPVPVAEQLVRTPKRLAAPGMAAGRGRPAASPDPLRHPADPGLIAALGAAVCLRTEVLPWRRVRGAVLLFAVDPRRALADIARIEAALGPVRIRQLDRAMLRAALLRIAEDDLVAAAETRVPAAQSCRNLGQRGTALGLAGATLLVILAAVSWPGPALAVLTGIVLVSLVASTALKAISLLAALHRARAGPVPAHPVLVRPPVVSLLVPLYRETEIASHLLARLAELEYPSDRLDLCLVLEADDLTTRAALDAAVLPGWAQVITVPKGALRTKPRALNFALDFARGSIIGIYDAEDAPAPDQLRQVVHRFAERGSEVGCLQGVLDYYNSRANWIARCFTLEYAAWFRVMLPGLERLGLVIPLGGTTLFLRREAIEAVGGWDAHNVTEDADLGLRLARHGYRTELIDSVTEEEANARAWPWVRQRTRWLKGYAITWAVHMRAPRTLWRELGAWRFWGVQVLFLGTLSQFLLAPLVWSFWLVLLAVPGPMLPAMALPIGAVFLFSGFVTLSMAGLGASRSGKPAHTLWAPLLMLYYPLATLAAWRGVTEVLTRPFYWDKTTHGLSPGVLRQSPQLMASQDVVPLAVTAPAGPFAHQA